MESLLDQLKVQFSLPLENPVLIFALILLIILLAPIILRRLKVPGIIGLILAGVLIGPHGLNLLAKNSAVDLFATIGLLYLMFIAGLELELNEFKRFRYHSIGFGFLTFLLPLALGFPACYYLLGYDFIPSLLTASMFATHTMVAYPIVTKFGISKNKAVAITIGGTILTDTAVLLLLAVITGAHGGNVNGMFWLRLIISITALLVIMFVLVPKVAKWFFTRLEGEKTTHYVFVLAIVFLAAFMAQIAGLEPIIGAFIAGLALNKLVPQSSVLMNRIQFVGNALFIPFFLISVGMLVNLRVLLNGPVALFVALVLSVTALIGKYAAARATQWIFGYSRTQGLLIFGLSASHAAATMAVIMVGYQAGIIDENILNGTILLILVTCLVASFATEQAAKKLVVEAEANQQEVVEEPSGRESIMVPIANYSKLEGLLEFTQYIRDKRNYEPVRVLSVIDEEGDAASKLISNRIELERKIGSFALSDSGMVPLVIADRNIPAGINRISRELDATTIILGWPMKEKFTEKLFGQKLEHVLNNSEQSILVCRLIKPLNTCERIVMVCPPLSEREKSFDYLIRKVFMLSSELNRPVHLYSDDKTREEVVNLSKKFNYKTELRVFEFRRWEYFNVFLKRLTRDDIAVILSARKGSVSHIPVMDHLVEKFNSMCPDQTVIIAYPMVDLGDDKYDKYQDFYAEPLNRTVETFRNIQRGLGKVKHKAE